MQHFSGLDLLAREISNGMWAVSGLVMLAVVVGYIVKEARQPGWWREPAVQFAMAMGLLVTGHIIRAAFSWMEFIGLSHNIPTLGFAFVAELYFTAIVLTVFGKLLCIAILIPPDYRWSVLGGTVVLTIGIPVTVYWLL